MSKGRFNAWLATCGLIAQLTLLLAPLAQASTVFTITAPDRTDMVYDSRRQILYVTSGPSVLRYSLKTKKFLSAINLGGTLIGIDLSPNGNTLAVADETVMSLNLVDLLTLKFRKLPIQPGENEVGLYDVAWGSDTMVYAAAALPAGWTGWVSLLKVNPQNGSAKVIGGETVTNYTVLRASADRKVIGFAQGDISDGRWGAINVKKGTVTLQDGDKGTSWYNYDIAVANDGTRFSLPTYGGLFIYDNTFTQIWTLGQYAVQYFDGVAYSPTSGNLYAAQAGSDTINVYSGKTFQQIGTYRVGVTFPGNENIPFSNGVLRFSKNGVLLFVSVPGGIDYFKVP
jgi:hypothetical protein